MKSLQLTLCLLVISIMTLAQAPDAFKYQAAIRNSEGQVLANQNISLRFTIEANGSEVYSEDHLSVSTNDHGIVSLSIGSGTSGDDFEAIDWSNGSHTMTIELDENGGTAFVTMGATVLESVPYALHAKTAENVDDADASPTNEIQTLSINDNVLTISSGNSVELPAGGDSVETEQVAKAWAHVSITGDCNTSFDAYNVTSTVKSATGVYVVLLEPGLFSTATNPSVMVTMHNDLSPGVGVATYSSSPSQITVRTYDMNGNLSDRGFNITVFGK